MSGTTETFSNYVWKFKVKTSTGETTVGVKAVAIDTSILDTEVTKNSEKVITSGAVWSAIQGLDKITYKKSAAAEGSSIPSETPSDQTEGYIYLVKQTDGTFKEFITLKDDEGNYSWEALGTSLPEGMVLNTDYATTSTGGVIKSSSDNGKISVDSSTGIASLNGYDDLAKSEDVQTTSITENETSGVQTITIKQKDKDDQTATIKPAYDTIKIKTSSSEEAQTYTASAGTDKTTFQIVAGDNITLTPTTTDGNPTLTIAASGSGDAATLAKRGNVYLPQYADGCIDLSDVDRTTSTT